MTDAELITRLRADVDAHVMTGNGGMKRVEAIRLAADRLTQLSEDNERMRKALRPFAEVTILPTGAVVGLERYWFDCASAAIAQGQKEGEDR